MCLKNKLEIYIYFLAITAAVLFFNNPVHDPDLGWQMMGGAKILEQINLLGMSIQNLVPHEDFINARSYFWHDYHWLWQILFFKVYQYGGYELQAFIYFLIIAVINLLILQIVKSASSYQFTPTITLLLAIPSAFLIVSVTSVRPQTISILFIALSVLQLLRKPTKYEIPLLFLYSIILVNIHVYWVFIPFIWLMYRCLPRLIKNNSNAIHVWGGFLLLCFAGFVSPYGILHPENIFINYYLIWEYLTMNSELKKYIVEFLSPFGNFNYRVVIILLYVGILFRKLNWYEFKTNAGIHLTGIISLYLFIDAAKFSAIFAILALPSAIILTARTIHFFQIKPILKNLFLVIFSFYLVYTAYINQNYFNDFSDKIRNNLPIEACSKIAKAADTKFQTTVLTDFTHGGWCRWTIYQKAPQKNVQVTTDSRTQYFPPDFYFETFELYRVKEGWNKSISKRHIDYILAPRNFALSHVLPFLNTQWKNIYAGNKFAVYEKR